jgi:hypothetical protein
MLLATEGSSADSKGGQLTLGGLWISYGIRAEWFEPLRA